VWGETAGVGGDEQVIRERLMRVFVFGLRSWLAGCSDGYGIEVTSFELLQDLGGLHIIARPYVARAYESIIRSPSLCTTSFSWSRHAH
jgi:hypothetical protein